MRQQQQQQQVKQQPIEQQQQLQAKPKPSFDSSTHIPKTSNKPDGSATMKFSSGGAKLSDKHPEADGTKHPVVPGAKRENANTMKFSSGGAKTPPQNKPAYSMPAGIKAGQRSTVLERKHGDTVLHQVNSARSNMHGVNTKRLPPGQVVVHKDGGLSINASRGRQYKVRTDGTVASYSERGRTAAFRANGSIRTLHAGGMDIKRGPHNERRIVTVRRDKSMLVATGPQRGYLQRRFVHNNRTFIHRAYAENGIVRGRVYRSYAYHGVAMQSYVPAAYYPPAFYRWAYNPWRAPVRYSWGWQRDPWYGEYSGYFTPLAAYPSSAFWLTDYVLAEHLRAAYLSRSGEDTSQRAEYAQDASAITPETREMIAAEVQRQLAEERKAAENPNQEANNGELSTTLSDPNRLFIVSSNLDVAADDQECDLTPGDVLRLNGMPAEGSQTANLQVVSSKSGSCPASSVVTIALNDLQEMDNSMRERIYDGLDLLRKSNGSKGIPAAPRVAMSPPRNSDVADLGPEDEDVLALLQSQQNEADQAEEQVIQSAFTDEHAMNRRQN